MAPDRTGLRPPDSTHVPTRTCVGCRRTDSRSVLLRVVLGAGADGIPVLRPDPRRVLAGRGAWLHPTRACLDLAVRRRAFARALRYGAVLDTGEVTDWIEGIVAGQPSTKGTESGFDADEHPMSTQR